MPEVVVPVVPEDVVPDVVVVVPVRVVVVVVSESDPEEESSLLSVSELVPLVDEEASSLDDESEDEEGSSRRRRGAGGIVVFGFAFNETGLNLTVCLTEVSFFLLLPLLEKKFLSKATQEIQSTAHTFVLMFFFGISYEVLCPNVRRNRVGGCTAKKEGAYIELMWEWRDDIHALSILITKE